MTDDTTEEPVESKVLAFGRRSKGGGGSDQRVPVEGVARRLDTSPVSPPTDGIVLACACGGTLLEMLNGGAIRCARCSRLAPGIYWTVEKGAKPPRGAS